MDERAQYHTTWPLLRTHANQVMYCTRVGEFITSHLQRRGLRLIAYSLPLFFSFFDTHTHNQIHLQAYLWNPHLHKLASRVRGCENLNKSVTPSRQEQRITQIATQINYISYGHGCKQLFSLNCFVNMKHVFFSDYLFKTAI